MKTAELISDCTRSTRLLIYQKGIQQGNPDVASALGVILVIVVLIIGLVNIWLSERGNK